MEEEIEVRGVKAFIGEWLQMMSSGCGFGFQFVVLFWKF